METAADNPFTAILSDGEAILWIGKPDKSSQIKNSKKGLRLFALALLIFLIVSALSSLYTGNTVGLKLTGLYSAILGPIAIGLLFVSKVATPQWQYAVTDKHIFFYNPHSEGNSPIGRLGLDRIKRVTSQPKSGAVGNIRFETKFLALESGITFYHVADVAEVQELVVSLLTGTRPAKINT